MKVSETECNISKKRKWPIVEIDHFLKSKERRKNDTER